MFTLSGAHVFPLYDGAVKADPPMRLLDVRHEQTAVFAAEATAQAHPHARASPCSPPARASPTASAPSTQAQFNGSPLVVLGGRAPADRWGTGACRSSTSRRSLAPVTKHAAHRRDASTEVAERVDEAFTRRPRSRTAARSSSTSRWTSSSAAPTSPRPRRRPRGRLEPDPDDARRRSPRLLARGRSARCWCSAPTCGPTAPRRPPCGSSRPLRLPVDHQRHGPRRRSRPATRCSSPGPAAPAFGGADLVVVVGTPLDFRLGYGVFGGKDGADARAGRAPRRLPRPGRRATPTLAASAAGDLTAVARRAARRRGRSWSARPTYAGWVDRPAGRRGRRGRRATPTLLASRRRPDPPRPHLRRAAARGSPTTRCVIGDGGDFVSFAGKYVEPARPGGWLDPGPYGCLGTGLGYAIAARLARPSAQVVLLLGDGAAGFSLMDVDTLVRHDLPVVMVVGNNGIWGLEKHPMQLLYGYDVAADLAPADALRRGGPALGGGGRDGHRPARDRRRRSTAPSPSGVPYLVNVITDPTVAYPRTTTGI